MKCWQTPSRSSVLFANDLAPTHTIPQTSPDTQSSQALLILMDRYFILFLFFYTKLPMHPSWRLIHQLYVLYISFAAKVIGGVHVKYECVAILIYRKSACQVVIWNTSTNFYRPKNSHHSSGGIRKTEVLMNNQHLYSSKKGSKSEAPNASTSYVKQAHT